MLCISPKNTFEKGHFTEKHLANWDYPECTFPWTCTFQNVHLAEWTFSQKPIFQNWHLPECTFGRMDIFPKTHFPELTLARMYIWPIRHFLENLFSRIDTCQNVYLMLAIIRGGVEDTKLEAKAKETKNFWGQGQTLSRPRPRTKDTDASVLQKKIFKNFFQAISKTKGLQIFFSGNLYLRKPKTRSLQIFRKVSGVFQGNFNGSKIVLSSSRGQGNFRGLEASRPRPRTSKCVLEAKDVLEDSTSGNHCTRRRNETFFSLVSRVNICFMSGLVLPLCAVHFSIVLRVTHWKKTCQYYWIEPWINLTYY